MLMEYMDDIIFVIIIIPWVLLIIQSHKLLFLFVKKYPDIAKNKIPYAFERFADPGKIIFFFKKENLQILKADKEVWRLRQQTKILMFLSVLSPVSVAAILVIASFLQNHN